MTDTSIDFDNLDPNDSEGMKNVRAAYERQRAAAEEATQRVADLESARRSTEIKSLLKDLNAPETIAELYPGEGPVTKEAMTAFLKDKVGLPVELLDQWGNYERNQGGERQPVGPGEDPLVTRMNTELKRNEEFYRRTNKPTDKEEAELTELKNFVFNKHNQWDADVASGKMAPLVDATGFGGFLDPPSYARRARHYVSQV